MNNVMSQAKSDFLNFSNKGKNESLSKLEFTKHVFEEIHEREMRELKLALCGLSEEYQLAKIVEHLTVPTETWFEWTERISEGGLHCKIQCYDHRRSPARERNHGDR